MYQLEHNLNYKYSMADLMHSLTSKSEHSARSSLPIPSGLLLGFVAQTLWEGFLQAKWTRGILTKEFGQQSQRNH